MNLWTPIAFLPATLLPFFKTGPFALDGLLVFWLGAAILSEWFISMAVVLGQALTRAEAISQN